MGDNHEGFLLPVAYEYMQYLKSAHFPTVSSLISHSANGVITLCSTANTRWLIEHSVHHSAVP